MSWSIQRVGTKAAVLIACTADLDRCALSYKGDEEEKDILAAKDRLLAAINGIDVTPDTDRSNYGVQVAASGHASKFAMSMQISVTRVALTLDERKGIGPSDPPESPTKPPPNHP